MISALENKPNVGEEKMRKSWNRQSPVDRREDLAASRPSWRRSDRNLPVHPASS